MMAALRAYLLGVVGAALAVSMASAFLKESAVKRAVLLTGGLLLALAVLAPAAKADLSQFGRYLSEISLEKDALAGGVPVTNRKIQARLIREKTEAYILDKAGRLGASVTADVTLSDDTGTPYPVAVTIRGVLTARQREALSEDLEESLAIPAERQVFEP